MTLYSTGKAFRLHPASWSSRTALFTSASPTWPQTSADVSDHVTTLPPSGPPNSSRSSWRSCNTATQLETENKPQGKWANEVSKKQVPYKSITSKIQLVLRVNWKRHVRHLHNMQVSSGCRISNAASSSSSFILEMVPKQPKAWKSWPNQILILRIENPVCQVIDLTIAETAFPRAHNLPA